jgi:8-amino-7-oxononanoate synthase
MNELETRHKVSLQQRQDAQQRRRLRSSIPMPGMMVSIEGSELINFASNDYLGLTQSPFLKERAAAYTFKYGVGSGASRLVSGNVELYESIESKLAELKGTESALLLSSGFQTNSSCLAALAGTKSRLFCDRFSHNSMLQGAMLGGGRWTRYFHNDLDDLKKRLKRDPARDIGDKWIVTESIFSMDGDETNLDKLIKLARENGAHLYIDDAHAAGVLGENGMGLASGKKGIDIIMGSFSKAFGSFGGYVACSKVTRDFLVNFCSGLIYSTALPPSVLGSIEASLELVPTMHEERKRLTDYSNHVRSELKALDISVGNSASQIIPVIVGCELDAIELSRFLETRGIFAPAIRPPTVPQNTARVRLTLSAAHSESQIETLIEAIKKWKTEG